MPEDTIASEDLNWVEAYVKNNIGLRCSLKEISALRMEAERKRCDERGVVTIYENLVRAEGIDSIDRLDERLFLENTNDTAVLLETLEVLRRIESKIGLQC